MDANIIGYNIGSSLNVSYEIAKKMFVMKYKGDNEM